MIVASAKQEITDFLESKEAGIESSFSKISLQNAAEKMFTANGLQCPVAIIEREGSVFLLNRALAFSDNVQ
jgi:hypothetical protein